MTDDRPTLHPLNDAAQLIKAGRASKRKRIQNLADHATDLLYQLHGLILAEEELAEAERAVAAARVKVNAPAVLRGDRPDEGPTDA